MATDIIRTSPFTDFTLIAISLFLIVIFWVGVMYLLSSKVSVSEVYLSCEPGKCATNIFNGEKRCPQDSSNSIIYDPTYEVCNSRYTCENSLTPYALMTDGSTNDLGVCEPGILCRCVSKPRCASELLGLFTLNNGGLSESEAIVSRVQYYQTSRSSEADYGAGSIEYKNPESQLCSITALQLPRVIPRNPSCNFGSALPTVNQIYACLETDTPNPCAIGRMAYLPDLGDSFAFTSAQINTTRLGCFPNNRLSSPSPCNDIVVGTSTIKTVSVWDRSVNRIRCVSADGTYYD